MEWANTKAIYAGALSFLHLSVVSRVFLNCVWPVLSARWVWRTPLIALLATLPTTTSIVYARTLSKHRISLSLPDFILFMLPVAGTVVAVVAGFENAQDHAVFVIAVTLQLLAFRTWDYAPCEFQEALDDMTNEIQARFDYISGPFCDAIGIDMYFADLLAVSQDGATIQSTRPHQALKRNPTAEKATQTLPERPSGISSVPFPFDNSTLAAAEHLRYFLDFQQDQIDGDSQSNSDYSDQQAGQPKYSTSLTNYERDDDISIIPTVLDDKTADLEAADFETHASVEDAQLNENTETGTTDDHVQEHTIQDFDQADIFSRQFEEIIIVKPEYIPAEHSQRWKISSDSSSSTEDEDSEEDMETEPSFPLSNSKLLEVKNHSLEPEMDDLIESLLFHLNFKEASQPRGVTPTTTQVQSEEPRNIVWTDHADVHISNPTAFQFSVEATTETCSIARHFIADQVEKFEVLLPLDVSAIPISETKNVPTPEEQYNIQLSTDEQAPVISEATDEHAITDDCTTLESTKTASPPSALANEVAHQNTNVPTGEKVVLDFNTASQSAIESDILAFIETPLEHFLPVDWESTSFDPASQPPGEDHMEILTVQEYDNASQFPGPMEDIAVVSSTCDGAQERSSFGKLHSPPFGNYDSNINEPSLVSGQINSLLESAELSNPDDGDNMDCEKSPCQPCPGFEPLPPVAPPTTAANTSAFDWQAGIDFYNAISTDEPLSAELMAGVSTAFEAMSSEPMVGVSTAFDDGKASNGGFLDSVWNGMTADTVFGNTDTAMSSSKDYEEETQVEYNGSISPLPAVKQSQNTTIAATRVDLTISSLLNDEEEKRNDSQDRETRPAGNLDQEAQFVLPQLSSCNFAPQGSTSLPQISSFAPTIQVGVAPIPTEPFELKIGFERFEEIKSAKSTYSNAEKSLNALEYDDISDDDVNSDGLSEPEDEQLTLPTISSVDEAKANASRLAANIELQNEEIRLQLAEEDRENETPTYKVRPNPANEDKWQELLNAVEALVNMSASTETGGDDLGKSDLATEQKQLGIKSWDVPKDIELAQMIDPKTINRPIKALRRRRALKSTMKSLQSFSGPGDINLLSEMDSQSPRCP